MDIAGSTPVVVASGYSLGWGVVGREYPAGRWCSCLHTRKMYHCSGDARKGGVAPGLSANRTESRLEAARDPEKAENRIGEEWGAIQPKLLLSSHGKLVRSSPSSTGQIHQTRHYDPDQEEI